LLTNKGTTMPRADISRLRGSLTALITPFRDGKLDEKAFQDFVAWQIDEVCLAARRANRRRFRMTSMTG